LERIGRSAGQDEAAKTRYPIAIPRARKTTGDALPDRVERAQTGWMAVVFMMLSSSKGVLAA